MKNHIGISILAILLFACSPKEDISVLNKTFINGIGIYQISDDTLVMEEINKELAASFPEFSRAQMVSSSYNADFYYLNFEMPSANFNPPDSTILHLLGRDLSTDEKLKLQKYTSVISIVFGGVSENIFAKQKRILDFIEKICKNKQVIIADFNSNEWFNPKSWTERRVINFNDSIKDIAHQITVHLSQNGEFLRAVTKGMNKFCLPDIVVRDFKIDNQNAVVNLLNAVAQILSENPFISNDSTLIVDLKAIKNDFFRNSLQSGINKNAKEIATIRLKQIAPEFGDNHNTQLLISFDDPKYSTPQAQQDSLISALFGTKENIVTVPLKEIVKSENKDILQEKISELKEMFHKGLEPGYTILVNAPFRIPEGGNEWMWVEVTKWREQSLNGILKNQPVKIKYLKKGAVVTVMEKDINDYVLYKPDGSYEGKIRSTQAENK